MLTRRRFLFAGAAAAAGADEPYLLRGEDFRQHVDYFNGLAPEEPPTYISDAQAWEWMSANVPLFTCPDRDVEQIYYYRWWTWRKHIKQTPLGFVVTEFLKPVRHAGEYNALSCALGHHIAEGRWVRDPRYIDQDVRFWLATGDGGGIRKNLHQFSGWVAAALYDRYLADGRQEELLRWLDALVTDYTAWEAERLTPAGLFWQRDVSDGMEESISGGRRVRNLRPTINSYMYGNAEAISAIASMAGNERLAREYGAKAARLKDLVERRLWNPGARFFETVLESGEFAGVREQIGFTPWYFGLPAGGRGFEIAWKQLMDPRGFSAPFGPTTAERRHPQFKIAYQGDDCQWNGPSWPFSTTITLRALANVLHGYRQRAASREDYFHTFLIYTRSQHRTREDGRVIPWIDEDLNPLTGEWLARAKKLRKQGFYGRGDYYNHSAYADLVITGVAGLRPRADDVVEVNPLVPSGRWDWFCLDRVPYHGRHLTILWDKTGKRFGRGKGLRVFCGRNEIARGAGLARITGRLPSAQ